jgi:hypothetical protein
LKRRKKQVLTVGVGCASFASGQHAPNKKHMKKLTIKCAAYRDAVSKASATGAAFTCGGLPATPQAAEALYWAALAPFGFAFDANHPSRLRPILTDFSAETIGGHVTVWFPLPPSHENYGQGSDGYLINPIRARFVASGAAKLFRKWAGVFPQMRTAARWQISDLRGMVRNIRNRCDPLASGGFIRRARGRNLTPEVFKYDRAIGVEFETFGPDDDRAISAALPIWAQRKSDGSIRPRSAGQAGHEIVALLVRREMEPRLFRLCQKMKDLGLEVNSSCGFHVHLDQRGETLATVKKRAAIIDKWLSALRELVPASRRENSYCLFGISLASRYHAVNLTSFSKYRTLEVRLHSGTCDYTKALAWIRLIEMLAALPKGPRAASGCIATLEQLPLAAHDLAYWRARHAQLNPHLYGSTNAAEAE